jgi:hypothetical protein
MLERICLLGLLAAGLSLAACAETPLEPTDAMQAPFPVTISSAPDPARAVPSTGVTYLLNDEVREYAFLASFDLIVRAHPDNAVGISVESDSIALQELTSAPVDGPGGGVDRERYEFESRADVNRLEPGGQTSREFDVWYALPNGGREVLISVTLNFIDDNGVTFHEIHTLTVEPR